MEPTATAVPLAIEWARELGLDWGGALLVVLAALGIYVAVVVASRVQGPRPLTSFSTFDIVVSVAVGSLVGRVVLVRTSLLAGVLGLTVLLALQATIRHVRSAKGAPFVEPRARLLVWNGEVVEDQLRRSRVSPRDLHSRLRVAGIADIGQVKAAVFERDGEISVIRGGATLDLEVFADVTGVPGDRESR